MGSALGGHRTPTTVLIFLGAAPEAVAPQLLTHRYDACFAKEGCAGIFIFAQPFDRISTVAIISQQRRKAYEIAPRLAEC